MKHKKYFFLFLSPHFFGINAMQLNMDGFNGVHKEVVGIPTCSPLV